MTCRTQKHLSVTEDEIKNIIIEFITQQSRTQQSEIFKHFEDLDYYLSASEYVQSIEKLISEHIVSRVKHEGEYYLRLQKESKCKHTVCSEYSPSHCNGCECYEYPQEDCSDYKN